MPRVRALLPIVLFTGTSSLIVGYISFGVPEAETLCSQVPVSFWALETALVDKRQGGTVFAFLPIYVAGVFLVDGLADAVSVPQKNAFFCSCKGRRKVEVVVN